MSAPHEKSPIWQQAARLAVHVYAVTARFPDTERSGLIGGMRAIATGLAADLAAMSEIDDPAEAGDILHRQQQAVRRLQSHLAVARRLRFVCWFHAHRLNRRIQHYYHTLTRTGEAIRCERHRQPDRPPIRLAA